MKERERDRAVQRVILLEGCANLCVLVIKVLVGVSTNSLSIIGDALHSLSDLANNVVAWFIVKLSCQPPDRKHPYGHRKFETLAVFFLATVLAFLAFELVIQVFTRAHSTISSQALDLVAMGAVLLVNIALALWQRAKARQFNSDILLADASHTLVDVLTTCIVIAGWLLSAQGYFMVDKLCALGVAALVFYLAYKLFRRAAPSLLDETAIAPEIIRAATLAVEGVKSVRQVRSRTIGRETFVDMIITVDAALSTAASHSIADKIEERLQYQCQVDDISIHIEPHNNR